MEIILGIIIGILTVVGLTILIKVNHKESKNNPAPDKSATPASDCCGAHEICEFDKIKVDQTIIEYFDDEELDVYKNMNENAYDDRQIDQFRDVLYTLQPQEIQNWLLSIERREIQLPTVLVSEARMLIAEV